MVFNGLKRQASNPNRDSMTKLILNLSTDDIRQARTFPGN